jgi:hypothetical protein
MSVSNLPQLSDPTDVGAVSTYLRSWSDIVADARALPTDVHTALILASEPDASYLRSNNVVAYIQDYVERLDLIHSSAQASGATEHQLGGIEGLANVAAQVIQYAGSYETREEMNSAVGMFNGTVEGMWEDVVSVAETANNVITGPGKLLIGAGLAFLGAKYFRII